MQGNLSPASSQEFGNVTGSVTLGAPHVKAGVRKALAEETGSSLIYYRNLKMRESRTRNGSLTVGTAVWWPQESAPPGTFQLMLRLHDPELIRAISTFYSLGSQ